MSRKRMMEMFLSYLEVGFNVGYLIDVAHSYPKIRFDRLDQDKFYAEAVQCFDDNEDIMAWLVDVGDIYVVSLFYCRVRLIAVPANDPYIVMPYVRAEFQENLKYIGIYAFSQGLVPTIEETEACR